MKAFRSRRIGKSCFREQTFNTPTRTAPVGISSGKRHAKRAGPVQGHGGQCRYPPEAAAHGPGSGGVPDRGSAPFHPLGTHLLQRVRRPAAQGGARQNHRPINRIRKASSFCLLPPIISYTTVRIRFLQGASYAAYGRRSTIICLGEQAQQSAGRDSSGVESHVGHLRGMCTEIQSRRAPDEGGPGSFYLPEMRTSRHSAQGGCRPGPPARGIADSHSRNFILSAKPSPALCWFKERNA